MTISRELSENAPSKPVILYPRPTAFSAHPLISVDRAADELIDALLSESLLELAWEEHGFRGPARAPSARRAMRCCSARLIERIDAVLPMPNAPVMLALDCLHRQRRRDERRPRTAPCCSTQVALTT